MPLISHFPVAGGGGEIKQASGTFQGRNTVTVTGLGFRPSVVCGRITDSGNWSYGVAFYANDEEAYTTVYSQSTSFQASFTDDGFTLSGDFVSNATYKWYAYGE